MATPALLVEVGNGLPGANSFVTADEARNYAEARGYILPPDAEELSPDQWVNSIEALAIRSCDYLKSLAYRGTKVYPGSQYLPWPRSAVFYDGAEWPEDEIPGAIKDAQVQLMIEQFVNGVVLFPTTITGRDALVKREKVGPLETEYFASGSRVGAAYMPAFSALLVGWVIPRGFGNMRVLRG